MFTYNDSSLKDRILGDLSDGNFKRIEMHGTGNRELFVIDRIQNLICDKLKIAKQTFLYEDNSGTGKPTRRSIFELIPG